MNIDPETQLISALQEIGERITAMLSTKVEKSEPDAAEQYILQIVTVLACTGASIDTLIQLLSPQPSMYELRAKIRDLEKVDD